MKKKIHFETLMIHGKMVSSHWQYKDHIVPPISSSTSFRLESSERGAEGFNKFANPEFNRLTTPPIYIYDRLDEPNKGILEEDLALAHNAESCVSFSSGMAAISAAIGVLIKSGDSVVVHKTLYGCTYSLFFNWFSSRLGVKVKQVDLTNPEELDYVLTQDPTVMLVYGESPTNPTLDILDIKAISEIVKFHNDKRKQGRKIFLVIDNTFASPWCQRPLDRGADVVVESLTKHICGFGTTMGGAVLAPRILEPDLLLFRKDFGGVLAPSAAWSITVYGLSTLALRLQKQIETAYKVANFLESSPKVEKVLYPGLESHPQHSLARVQMVAPDGSFAPGSIIYFVLKGRNDRDKKEKGRKIMDFIARSSYSITLAVSLGQTKTLIEHPSSMTHAGITVEEQIKAGIEPGGIRMSIGIENSDDIIGDLDAAFSII